MDYADFEEIDQWTDVHGVSRTPTSTDHPRPTWTRTRYGAAVEAASLQGAPHNLRTSGMGAEAIRFSGPDQGVPTTTATTTTTATPSGSA